MGPAPHLVGPPPPKTAGGRAGMAARAGGTARPRGATPPPPPPGGAAPPDVGAGGGAWTLLGGRCGPVTPLSKNRMPAIDAETTRSRPWVINLVSVTTKTPLPLIAQLLTAVTGATAAPPRWRRRVKEGV